MSDTPNRPDRPEENPESFAGRLGRLVAKAEYAGHQFLDGAEKAIDEGTNFVRDGIDATGEYIRDGAPEDIRTMQAWVRRSILKAVVAILALFVAILVKAFGSTGFFTPEWWTQAVIVLVLGAFAAGILASIMLTYHWLRLATLASVVVDQLARRGTRIDRAASVFTTLGFAPAYFAVAATIYIIFVPLSSAPWLIFLLAGAFMLLVLAAIWNPGMYWVYALPAWILIIATFAAVIAALVGWEREVTAKIDAREAVVEAERMELRSWLLAQQERFRGTWYQEVNDDVVTPAATSFKVNTATVTFDIPFNYIANGKTIAATATHECTYNVALSLEMLECTWTSQAIDYDASSQSGEPYTLYDNGTILTGSYIDKSTATLTSIMKEVVFAPTQNALP